MYNKKVGLDIFLKKELTNGYAQPVGLAVVDFTRGPPTNRKQKRLYYASEKLREYINTIKNKSEFAGIEKLLIGLDEPDQKFRSNGVNVFYGDENTFCKLVRAHSRKEYHLKRHFANFLDVELQGLGGGAVWSGYLYDPSTRTKISDYILAVAHAGNLIEIINKLNNSGIKRL